MSTAFWRIVWKEYRAVRGFWLGIALLGIFWQWLFAMVMSPGLDRSAIVYATPLVAAALFVTGCLAAIFAAEREEETLGFLRNLPATSWSIARGKLAFAGLSTLLLAVVLWVSAGIIAGSWSDRAAMGMILAVFGVGVIECAAWAALFSLLWRRPLLVAVAAIAAASVVTHVAVGLVQPRQNTVWSLATYRDAWLARLALAMAVALAAGIVSQRWMDGGSFSERVADWWRRTDIRRRLRTEAHALEVVPPRLAAFPIVGRLLWQTWRQSWAVALLFVLFGPPIVGFVSYAASLASDTSPLAWWIGLSAVLGGLLGTLAFHADQEGRRYRFFAEHGERPGLVWLARLLLWGTALVLMSSFIHVAAGYGLIRQPADAALDNMRFYLQRQADYPGDPKHLLVMAAHRLVEMWSLLLWVGFSILVHAGGFCIGQLCSMAVRSGVIAGFLATIVTVLYVAWAALLVAWDLQGPIIGTLVVIPLLLLLATRLRARGWLLETGGWRAWLWPVGVVVVPVAFVAVSIPALRTELPEPVYSGPNLPTQRAKFEQAVARLQDERAAVADEASKTADLYLRACDLLEVMQPLAGSAGAPDVSIAEARRIREWIDSNTESLQLALDSNTESLQLALDAASRELCLLPPETIDNDRRLVQLITLQQLVNASGGHLARDGDLDEALQRHLAALSMTEHFLQFQQSTMRMSDRIRTYGWITAWARMDGQTPELLQRAIKAVEARPVVAPPLAEAVLADYFHLRSILLGEKDPAAGGLDLTGNRTRLAYIAHQLPWERKRALAVLDRVYFVQHSVASVVDQAYTQGVTSRFRISPGEPIPEEPELRTTYYLLELYQRVPDIRFLADEVARDEFYRRALLVNLGLAAYRLEHGKYPESLAELEGEYLSQLPTDNLALTERTFYYHPEGLDGWLHVQSSESAPIRPGTPLFWSAIRALAPFGETMPVKLVKRAEAGANFAIETGKGYEPFDLRGRPLYMPPTGAAVFRLPHDTEEDGEVLREGRPPERDGVPVERIDPTLGASGYSGGYGIE